MSEVLMKVDGVSKKFCRSLKKSLWYGMQDLGSEILGKRHGGKGELRSDEFWAVNDVSFEVKRGECLGLIGRNGAGKTTLLKMLNGLIKPDKGRIEMRGRVGALIALGAGFNPILTGRENIYVNASVLGLSKKETDRKLEEIVDFAEIEEFMDSPVQTYSSGMQVRLGFAVASSLEPDILLLDEVLAVGDAGFRAKCYNRVDSISNKAAIIFVSHAMPQIARMCQKTILLEKGGTEGVTSVEKGVARFESASDLARHAVQRLGSKEIRFDEVSINGVHCHLSKTSSISMKFGDRLNLELIYSSDLNCDVIIDITFHSLSGDPIAECNNFVLPYKIRASNGKTHKLEVIVDKLTLNPGAYNFSLLLMSENMMGHYDWLKNICVFYIQGTPAIAGQQFLAQWYSTDLNR